MNPGEAFMLTSMFFGVVYLISRYPPLLAWSAILIGGVVYCAAANQPLLGAIIIGYTCTGLLMTAMDGRLPIAQLIYAFMIVVLMPAGALTALFIIFAAIIIACDIDKRYRHHPIMQPMTINLELGKRKR
jgi:hypothetical protein